MDFSVTFWWVLGTISFFLGLFFSLIKNALYSASIYKLEKIYFKKKRKEEQHLLKFYLGREKEILWISITLESLASFVFALVLFFGYVSFPKTVSLISWAFILGSASFFFLVCGILSKIIGTLKSEIILYHTLPSLYQCSRVFFPLVSILLFLEKIITRLYGLSSDLDLENAKEEIMEAAREGERHGLLEKESKHMIESLIEFAEADVAEIMVPRTEMDTLDVDTSIQESAKFAIEKGRSRIPVYENNKDSIIGILYVKDLFGYWLEKEGSGNLREVIRKPYFVPETKCIDALLKEFKSKKVHIAIVLDEYGGTAGLSTIEDILEEIVGEIADEYDVEEEENFIQQLSKNTYEINARIHIDELNEELDLHLSEEEDYETFGGFVISYLGKIPSVGEKFNYENMEFTILQADERKINSVKIVRSSSE